MDCYCNYPLRYRATDVTVADEVTTIQLATNAELVPGTVYDIGLFTAIPNNTDGTQVIITNGTVTGSLMQGNGNYFRPLPLCSRTILRVQYFSDPEHFQKISVRR